MRDLFTGGVGMAEAARPKTRSTALTTKEPVVGGFQTMLNTACGENGHGPVRNPVRDGQTGEVNLNNQRLPKGMVAVKGKNQAETVVKTCEESEDYPSEETLQDASTQDQLNVADPAAFVPQITPTVMPQLAGESLAVAADDSLPADSLVAPEPAATPEPTVEPTATPETEPKVTRVNPSLVAVTQAGKQVASDASQVIMPAAINARAQVAGDLMTTVDGKLSKTVLSGDLGLGWPQSGTVKTANGQVISQPASTEGLAEAVTINPAMADKLTAATTPRFGVEQAFVRAGREAGDGPQFSQAFQASEVTVPELTSGLPVANAGPVLTGLTPTTVNLTGGASSTDGFAGVISTMALPEEATNGGTGVTDGERLTDLNTVIAGSSLQKNVKPPTLAGVRPGAGAVSVLSPLTSLTIADKVLPNQNNDLAKTNPARSDLTGGLEADPGTLGAGRTPSGAGQLTLRQAAGFNHNNATDNTVNLASAPTGGRTVSQTGTEKTLVSSEAVAIEGHSGDAAVRETKPGLSPAELSDAVMVDVSNPKIQVPQMELRQETPVVGKNEVFAQIVDQARIMVHQGQSELEMNLKPEHLGKLKLKIAVEHQVVTAQFTVESEQVKQIIETNLVQLRKLLQDAGTQVQNLTVSVGQHEADANYSQQSNSGGPGNQPRQRGQASEQALRPNGQTAPKQILTKSNVLVDLIA
jgi:flagellar hook-length control protein FliK